jgi:putative spermidine/putrescine transport system permease protein|tara:strand:+ start:6582 stop:7397 length:816 start_codon:yes stop_codon:yes gene_type:complete
MSSQESYGSRLPYKFLVGLVTIVILFLEAPLIILVIQSFTAESYLAFPPPSYGIRWYKEVLTSEDWLNSISLSLIIAAVVTPLSLVLGTMAAFALDRGPKKLKHGLQTIMIAPMVLPHIVLGLGLFKMALQLDIDDSMLAYIPAHLTITIPFVIISVGASLQTFEVSLEEAARSLGASRFWAVWYITLPIIRPALIAGSIFSFIISFDEFIITFFLTTFQRTLPIEMFSTLMYQVKPSIAAVSTLTLAVTAFLTAMLILRGQVTSGDKVIK